MENSNTTDSRTALMRIQDLESVVTQLYQAVSQQKSALESLLQTQGEMALVKDVLKILNKKTEAIIQILDSPDGKVNAKSVSDLVISMNVQELTQAVTGAVANGNLVATDTVADGTYLVVEELDAEGTVVNPRVQFPLGAQEAATQDAIKGKKAGDVVSFGEGKLSARVLEVYTIVDTKAASAETPTADAPAAETAAETPAETTTTEVAPAAQLDPIVAETPNTFELQYHGEPESKLASGN